MSNTPLNAHSQTNPKPYYNRPGLPALSYRLGDYTSFRERLLSQLTRSFSSLEQPQGVSLKALTTRDSDDPAIAFLDAFAVLADVITFYQERIANEGYLLTATERRSIVELARTIGYELNPGVAASTLLVFTVDEAPGSPIVVTIPQGTQIQSIPEREELPQTFETSLEFIARLEWNALKPRSDRPQKLIPNLPQLYLQGTSTQLQPGESVLLMDGDGQDGNRSRLILKTVTPNPIAGNTRITWNPVPLPKLPAQPTILAFRQPARLFGYNAPLWESMPDAIKQEAATKHGKSIRGGVFRSIDNGTTLESIQLESINTDLPSSDVRCVAIGQSGNLFAGFSNGVFRSKDQGKTWKPATAGLSNLNIQTFTQDTSGSLYVGTAEGGVFRTKDDGESWTPLHLGSVRVEGQNTSGVHTVNTALPNTVVRSIQVYGATAQASANTLITGTNINPVPTGEISSNGTRLTIKGSGYPTWLKVGAIITANSQSCTIIELGSYSFDATLTVTSNFTEDVSINLSVATDPDPHQVSITATKDTNTLKVTGQVRLNEFKANQALTIAGVARTIQAVNDYHYEAQVTVNPAFASDLTDGTPFFTNGIYIFAGTDDGVFLSVDQGKNWYARGLVQQTIRALEVVRNGATRLLFAATDRGLFRSNNDGQTWSEISTTWEATEKNLFSLHAIGQDLLIGTVKGILRYNSSTGIKTIDNTESTVSTTSIRQIFHLDLAPIRYILAATDQGLFRYQEAATQAAKQTQQLTQWGATALASSENIKLLLGTRFVSFAEIPTSQTGITSADPAIPIKEEWFDFEIQPDVLELDNKYPQILKDSWITLVNGEQIAARQVAQVAIVRKNDFSLSSEVTQLWLKEPVDPQQFQRRTTLILAQSEVLALAKDPLTVAVQQANIFFDPISAHKVFLSQYVAGLQPQQQVIVRGKRIQAEVNHVGGVVYSLDDGDQWQRLTNDPETTDSDPNLKPTPIPGLTNTAVTALISYKNNLLAGTTEGIFRLTDSRSPSGTSSFQQWESVNQGLTNLVIQAFATTEQFVFVATAGGVFRSLDGITWEAVNRNLVYLDVRSLLVTPTALFAGTMKGGIFRSIDNGNTWAQMALENLDIQALLITPHHHYFAATRTQGVFCSTDDGVSWQPLSLGLPNLNATTLAACRQPATGTLTLDGTIAIGQETRFRSEFAIGDPLWIGEAIYQVVAVLSDTTLRLQPLSQPIFSTSQSTNRASTTSFQRLCVLVGTNGSGIFRLQPDRTASNTRSIWQSITTQPADLTIRQLWVHPNQNHLFAATSQAGLFRSVDYGDRWATINTGLTSLDAQLNPTGMVNTDFRAITLFQQDQQTQLVAGGIGMLISPDNLYTAPIRAGDRLQIMAPPQPLLPRDPESIPTQAEKPLEQKWLLQNQDGFIGVVMTPNPQDITLKPATDDDEIVSEIGEVLLPPSDQQQPILTLTEPLQNSYDPATVQIHANVVPATHGETVTEVLGSGDSSQNHQRFGLKKPPLTYVAAPTVSGAASTLQVRVNQVLWQEVPSLYLRSPQEQVYLTRHADDGAVTLIFGDGKSGMRLPTGMENVTASYRSGIGLSGQVGADRLSLLKIRPLGISQVTNPLPATGAADPETMTEARTSAPLTVRTLGRIVSLQDYEDFARSFAGIGKAQATVISTGNTQSVHITVAAIGGAAVLPTTALYENLMLAIANAHDPMQLVQVESYEKLLFNLEASLLINGRYKLDRVLWQVRQAVERRFAFEHRNFGQAVTAAEVIAAMQAVEGVVAIDLDALYRRDQARSLEQSIPALSARWDHDTYQILPAQMLLLNAAGIRFSAEVSQ